MRRLSFLKNIIGCKIFFINRRVVKKYFSEWGDFFYLFRKAEIDIFVMPDDDNPFSFLRKSVIKSV